MSYGLNLSWGGPIGDYIGLGGDPLRDILQNFSYELRITTNTLPGHNDDIGLGGKVVFRLSAMSTNASPECCFARH